MGGFPRKAKFALGGLALIVLVATFGTPGNINIGPWAFLLLLYFVPAIVASDRGHRNATPIFILNLFFGWTVIGWVGCLAWGLSHQEARS